MCNDSEGHLSCSAVQGSGTPLEPGLCAGLQAWPSLWAYHSALVAVEEAETPRREQGRRHVFCRHKLQNWALHVGHLGTVAAGASASGPPPAAAVVAGHTSRGTGRISFGLP